MNRCIPLCAPLCAMALALLALPAQGADSREEANKKIVLDFYDKAINKKDFEAASVHLGDKYIQHNPLAADGPEGLKKFLEYAKQNIPDFRTEFKHVFADGDYVIVHAHARARPNDPADRGSAVMDIFRLENGKVVEHWDVVQPVPEKANNTNTMF
jgi:predicted SnoaL-like aldol condensation-catalyzing enzyme